MSISPQERKEATEARLIEMGIACNPWLPVIGASDQVKRRDLDSICRRAIACLLSTQVACDIEQGDYEKSITFFGRILRIFGAEDALNPMERRLFDGSYTKQDVINAAWEYETFWALAWALGLTEDISDASTICDCQKAIHLVGDCRSFAEFKAQCHLRDTEEILDMLDLYFRYHWAVVHKRVQPDTNIGDLQPGVVVERRRGLEWLFHTEDDWYQISLDT